MKEWLMGRVEASAHSIEKSARGLSDRAGWSPLDKGRTAIDQLAECALITGMVADIVSSGVVPTPDWEAYGRAKAALDTVEAAAVLLRANTEKLALAYSALADEDAARTVVLPWGTEYSLLELPSVILWNNTYHEGQINYIDTLGA